MANTNRNRRSAEEAARLVADYERSGMTRREYCQRQGIPTTTLDYYRRRQSERRARALAHLAPVKLEGEGRPAPGGFALVLSNGRRIEGSWGFVEEDLARLLRVAERA
jgi:hypothetical protein